MEKITLWTRQVSQVWQELQQSGEYAVKEEYIREKNDTISDFYLELYRWYSKEAGKHLAAARDYEYPIWLSVDEEMMLQPAEDTVILKVEAPQEEVVMCNNVAWGYRVNYMYVPIDSSDEQKHNDELKRYGISNEADLVMTGKGNFYPAMKRKIINSWERVFTQTPEKEADYVATMWRIKKEWVKEVREYGQQ